MNAKTEKICITPQATIGEALQRIDSGTEGIILVVDKSRRLMGTVTDGDIRRAVMRNCDMQAEITTIMNSDPVTAHEGSSRRFMENLMKTRSIRHVPVVDDDLCLKDIVFMRELIEAGDRPAALPSAVIMAGGLGTRLRSVTNDDIPKPLVKVDGKPILESIIDRLGQQGLEEIYISVNHKKEQIEEYFRDGSDFKVQINYIEEKKRLGTAGALCYLKGQMQSAFIVMNADLICDIKFESLMEYHRACKASLTVCSRKYEMQVPFGVLSVEDDRIVGLEEKPRREFFVNAGIYVLEPEVLEQIPDQQYLDMTDLIEKLIGAGLKVSTFPILSYWIDVGQVADYEKACRDLKSRECIRI